MKSEQSLVKVTHYGTVNFGPAVECEALVLATGERGFGRRQVMQLVGFHQDGKSGHFRSFLTEIAPNTLNLLDKKGCSVLMPSGQRAHFIFGFYVCYIAMIFLESATPISATALLVLYVAVWNVCGILWTGKGAKPSSHQQKPL